MTLGKFTLATFLLTAPAWAQFSRADMMKLATDRFDTATNTLKLSPDQVAAIKPLLESKCVDMGQVKDVYMASAKDDASKKTAKESLKAIHDEIQRPDQCDSHSGTGEGMEAHAEKGLEGRPHRAEVLARFARPKAA